MAPEATAGRGTEGHGREVGGRAGGPTRSPGHPVGVLGQAEQHSGQGDPVGEGVVDAEDERGARPVARDEVDLPERARPVERVRQVLLDVGLQLGVGLGGSSLAGEGRLGARAARGRSPGRPPSGSGRTAVGRGSGRWLKTGYGSRIRMRTRSRTRSQSGTDSSSTTDTMTMRLVGRSMLSQRTSAEPIRRGGAPHASPPAAAGRPRRRRKVVQSSSERAPWER